MAKYRDRLPQLSEHLFLTDGGLETTLIFQQGIDLPEFAAFDLLQRESGYQTLYSYYKAYVELAVTHKAGFILESPTWRANREWGEKLGYSPAALATANQKAIALLLDLRETFETVQSPMVVSGCIGPRGDGYQPSYGMTAREAMVYHVSQVQSFAASQADMVSAMTLNDCNEAIGITQAAQKYDMPVVISFTVETDGTLPTGQPLSEAIAIVDQETGNGPAYYMINCAHPQHFKHLFATTAPWVLRIKGLRANASTQSHSELDEAMTLDQGDSKRLGQEHLLLKRQLPQLSILGGCCGTDIRHLKAICEACLPVYWSYLNHQTLGHLIG